MSKKKKSKGIVEQMREAEAKKEKTAALLEKAQGYKYISPKTLRKLEKISKTKKTKKTKN